MTLPMQSAIPYNNIYPNQIQITDDGLNGLFLAQPRPFYVTTTFYENKSIINSNEAPPAYENVIKQQQILIK